MTGSFKGIRAFGNLCLWHALFLILTEDIFLPSFPLLLHSSHLPSLFSPSSLPASKPSVHCARHCAKGGSKNPSFLHLRYFSSPSRYLVLCQGPGPWGSSRKENAFSICSCGLAFQCFSFDQLDVWSGWGSSVRKVVWGKERWAGAEHGEEFGVHSEAEDSHWSR